MPTQHDCPTAEMLNLLLLGQAPAEQAGRLEEHLARCPHCAGTLETIRPRSFLAFFFRPQGIPAA